MRSRTFLIGAGVVGRAILQAHADASVSVCIADLDPTAVANAIVQLELPEHDWSVSEAVELGAGLSGIEIIHRDDDPTQQRPIVIESVSERLDLKRKLFVEAEGLFSSDAILCSNTSTLRINDIAAGLTFPERFCGMHFFMPIDRRPAVEVVRGQQTAAATIQQAKRHAERIEKQPLVVGDGPGFVVNRLLSPYLNEAMLLLSRGVSAARIEQAALTYGMPMSPLELIDWIGTRTVFDAGRAFWQAFPDRIDPSPIAPALLKRKRSGRANDAGFYDYRHGVRSPELPATVVELANSYSRAQVSMSDLEVLQVLSVPMWIEAVMAARDGIVTSIDQFETAMQGGLGFDSTKSWIGFFESIGSVQILAVSKKWGRQTAAIKIPPLVERLLGEMSPTEALLRSAKQSDFLG